jgi:hypothetical protein
MAGSPLPAAPHPAASRHDFSFFDDQALVPFFPARHFQRQLLKLWQLRKRDNIPENRIILRARGDGLIVAPDSALLWKGG